MVPAVAVPDGGVSQRLGQDVASATVWVDHPQVRAELVVGVVERYLQQEAGDPPRGLALRPAFACLDAEVLVEVAEGVPAGGIARGVTAGGGRAFAPYTRHRCLLVGAGVV